MPTLHWPLPILRLLGTRLPRTRGTLQLQELGRRVTIRRDRWGIPHIDAESGLDGWFALGFCHAQDRPFQLELLQRVGSGTLSALIGRDGLPIDRMSRRLGFRRTAEAQLPVIRPDVLAILEAYTAGINAGYRRGLPRPPHELALLRQAPTPWSVTDVLCFVGLQSFSLSSNWDAELARLKVWTDDGADAVRDLDPAYASWMPVASPPGAPMGETIDRLGEDLALLQAAVPTGGGSNSWAVAGSRTVSGRPILANDPHLAPRLPAPWYLAHIRTPDWEVAGASFVGGPALPIGTNGFAAWGITAALTDNTDLFLEEVGPDGRSVREGEGFVPCDVITEQIAVKGGATEEEHVLVTRRGPLITALLGDTLPQALSMNAVWLRPLPIRGFLETVTARSFEAFREAFAEWPGPALNLSYGDVEGHVGWQLVGQLPRRRRGNGTIPLPGWDEANGWHDELVPFDEMPFVSDPDTGWVGSANGRPIADDGSGPFLGADFGDGYRLARIAEVVESRDDWNVEAALKLQVDVTSVPWREIREFVLLLPVDASAHPHAARGLAILREWDGQVAEGSAGASVYEAFVAGLTQRLAEARAPEAWRWAIGEGFGQIVPRTLLSTRAPSRLARLLRERPAGWFEGASWEDEAVAVLDDAIFQISRGRGTSPVRWGWGSLRTLTLEHPMGVRRPLDRIFNLGPVPMGGDATTVMQASTGPIAPFGNPGFLANVRCVFDLGDAAASRFSMAGGQSGNPLSTHYADLFEVWRHGDGVPMAWTEAEVAAATRQTLVLEPAAAED